MSKTLKTLFKNSVTFVTQSDCFNFKNYFCRSININSILIHIESRNIVKNLFIIL